MKNRALSFSNTIHLYNLTNFNIQSIFDFIDVSSSGKFGIKKVHIL